MMILCSFSGKYTSKPFIKVSIYTSLSDIQLYLDQLLPTSKFFVCPVIRDYPDEIRFKTKHLVQWGEPFSRMFSAACSQWHIQLQLLTIVVSHVSNLYMKSGSCNIGLVSQVIPRSYQGRCLVLTIPFQSFLLLVSVKGFQNLWTTEKSNQEVE